MLLSVHEIQRQHKQQHVYRVKGVAGILERFAVAALPPAIQPDGHQRQQRKPLLTPVSYTHIDVYKRQVYNNFHWPTPTLEQKAKIEQTAQAILNTRAMYPNNCLADLYNPLAMPEPLLKAHIANDRAVMQAYGLSVKDTSEADCVAFLMKRYQELTQTK